MTDDTAKAILEELRAIRALLSEVVYLNDSDTPHGVRVYVDGGDIEVSGSVTAYDPR